MNKLKYIILFLLAVNFLTSCDDKLEVTNPNTATTAEFWKTEDHVAEGVIATYNRLLTDGCFCRMVPSLTDVRGDDVWSQSPWTIYPLSGDFTVLSNYDVVEWPWREWYIMIARANLVLFHGKDIEYSSPEYKNRLLGQAYFLRALTYYYLTEMYEKVPLILEVPENGNYYPKTSTRDEIIEAIISDLKLAQDMLPKSYDAINGPDKSQKGRATWGAATGLLAKAYLMKSNFESAKVELEKIVTSNQYSLVSNYGDNFTYENENNSESLFEVQFGNFGTAENWWSYSTSDWKQGNALGFNYGLTLFGAWGDLKPTKWLYEQFKKEATVDGTLDPRLYWTLVSYEEEYNTATDGRSNQIFGKDLGSYAALKNSPTIAKYTYARIPGHTAESEGNRLGSTINYRVLRYADILLLYAEVLNETGKTAEAYAPLKLVRDRAKLANLSETRPNMTQAEMRDEIVHQRVLELSIESIRSFDIKRWGWYYDSNKLAELATHDDEFVTWKAGHEYFPVPSGEMDNNPNLEPNSAN